MTIELRRADMSDCDLLYSWANDKEVRNNSFNINKIDYEEHKEWFKKKLVSNYTQIFILEKQEQKIGQIRIDIEGLKAIINYSIDKEYRGKKYGIKILSMIEKEVMESFSNLQVLEGKVKLNNISSQKCFEKNNYKKFTEESYITYKKIII